MPDELDVFLAHYGIPGMSWGKRRARSKGKSDTSSKPKMSQKKKVAIVVGASAAVAFGLAFAANSVSKNGTRPVSKLADSPEFKKGKQAFSPPAKPKAPSPYPMTPLIATPILDELLKKYPPPLTQRRR